MNQSKTDNNYIRTRYGWMDGYSSVYSRESPMIIPIVRNVSTFFYDRVFNLQISMARPCKWTTYLWFGSRE